MAVELSAESGDPSVAATLLAARLEAACEAGEAASCSEEYLVAVEEVFSVAQIAASLGLINAEASIAIGSEAIDEYELVKEFRKFVYYRGEQRPQRTDEFVRDIVIFPRGNTIWVGASATAERSTLN